MTTRIWNTLFYGLTATGIVVLAAAAPAQAGIINVGVAGQGVSASLNLTYGPATDAKYPNAFEITGISGTFSDSNNGLNIVNASIVSLVPITHDVPEPTNLLAPTDFSRFPVANGLPAQNNGYLTYDNLFWPHGSSPTASDYTVHGGVLDIYGVMFTLSTGQVVDVWSNGIFSGNVADYGVAVATSDTALDYVGGGVSASPAPEPATLLLFGAGLFGVTGARFRKKRAQSLRG